MTKRSKAAYMISSVSEQYGIHPQTLRLYEREGLLKPSRSDGNTRLFTDADLERLEVILKLTRDFGVNLAGVEIILNMREKMEEMQRQIEQFVSELNSNLAQHARPPAPPSDSMALIPLRATPAVVRLAGEGEMRGGEPRGSGSSRTGSTRTGGGEGVPKKRGRRKAAI